MYIQQIIRGIYVSVHKFLFTISSLFYPILSTLSSRVTWVFLCNIFKDKKGQRPDGLWHCSSMVYVFRVKIMMSSLSDVEFLFTSSPNPLVPSSTSSAQSSASISSPSQILILAPLRCCSPLQSPPYMKDKYLMALVKLNTQYCKRKCCSINIFVERQSPLGRFTCQLFALATGNLLFPPPPTCSWRLPGGCRRSHCFTQSVSSWLAAASKATAPCPGRDNFINFCLYMGGKSFMWMMVWSSPSRSYLPGPWIPSRSLPWMWNIASA